MKRLIGVIALAVLGTVLSTSVSMGATFDFTADIDGAQAGTDSTGVGFATATYDDQSSLLSWDIAWSGLLGNETVMHFHGPAPAGQNAGVQVNFGSISGTASPSIGSTSISAAQAGDLLNDLWYINIHTDRNPGGEIRGQVLLVPEPASVAGLVMAGFATLTHVRRRRRR